MTPAIVARAVAVALAALVATGPAKADPSSPELVIDASTGTVLHADAATRQWYPASTTKIMTAYVALRAVRAGELTLRTPLVASAMAARQPPSKIGIKPGQEITLENALKILMVKSANDVALVIAEGVGGSQEGFARRMNAEAARLGLSESHFVNPHGLFDTQQTSSARDLAMLARTLLIEFPDYREYWGIGAVQLGQRVMKNTNGLIGRYPGAEGMKTGFICPSGFNVVAMASRGGRTLIAVVLGAGSGTERSIRTAQLLDKGFGSSAIWSPSLGTIGTLPASGYGPAPNMRGEICRKGRKFNFGEEEDSGAAIIAASQTDSASVFAVMQPIPMPGAAGGVRSRDGAGRVVLGPRADLPVTQVYLGRAPDSTEAARGPAAAATTTKAATTKEPVSAAVGAPLRLPGVIGAPAGKTGAKAPPPRSAKNAKAVKKKEPAKVQSKGKPKKKSASGRN